MPPIRPTTLYEQLLYATIRLEVVSWDGTTSVGTGFFYREAEAQSRHLLVTNAHVIEGGAVLRTTLHFADVTATRYVPAGHVDVELELGESAWTRHSSLDLAAMSTDVLNAHMRHLGHELFGLAIGGEHIPPDLLEFDALEEVLMIGYPIGLYDRANNYPLLRRGISASHVAATFDGAPQFVVDVACLPGSSGSPVVLPWTPQRTKQVSYFSPSRLYAFMGIQAWAPGHQIDGEVVLTSDAVRTKSTMPSGLGVVIRASEVDALARSMRM